MDSAPSQADLLMTQAEIRELAGTLAELDLHGMNEAEARSAIYGFLNQLFMSGEQVGKIIHGKGTGKLAQVVREVLEEQKQAGIVERYGEPRKLGSAGAAVLVVVVEKE